MISSMMAFQVVAVVVVMLMSVVSGQTNGTMTAETFVFSWSIANSEIYVNFTAETASSTWSAIGFSFDNQMPITDVIIGANDGGVSTFVLDSWNPPFIRTGPIIDPLQSLTDASASRINNTLIITFKRQLASSDILFDVSLSARCVYVLWAYGGSVSTFTNPLGGLGGHSAKGVFPNQLCGCSSIVISLAVLLLGALVATFATY